MLSLAQRRITSSLLFSRSLRSASVLENTFASTTKDPDMKREVLVENRPNIRRVTLNRPRALNSLNLSMIREITPLYKEWMDHENVKLIILRGTGEKAFCAGGDVVSLYENCQNNAVDYKKAFFGEEYTLNHMIHSMPIPHVAVIDGITMGGGVGLSVHGSIRVATERTMFAMPETAIGFFPDVGGSYFLPRLQGNMGMYLALTGARLKGYDVLAAGIATHYVSSSCLDELDVRLSEISTSDINIVSETIKEFENVDGQKMSHPVDDINRLFAGDSVEEIVKNLEAEPDNAFAQAQLKKLKNVSPTALKVTFRQIREGAKLSMEECLQMEMRMAWRFMCGNDFFEGVRALLVDKDNQPKWNPDTLAAVSEADVDKYFAPLDEGDELKLPVYPTKPVARL